MKKLFALFSLLFVLPLFAQEDFGFWTRFSGTGTGDNTEVFTTTELTRFDACMISSSAGSVDVYGTLNGSTYTTAAISLQDFGATTNDPVLSTVAGRMYAVPGKYVRLRVLQNGGTAATAVMVCWKQ